MKQLVLLIAAIIPFSLASAKDIEQIAKETIADNEAVTVYPGKVGKLPAIFMIEWDGETVVGSYYHPAKGKNKTYQLEGKNPKPGILNLKEYTSKNGKKILTANIKLTKKVTKAKIIWSGTMHNTNGKKFPVSFFRRR